MALILDDIRMPAEWSRGSSGGPAFFTTRVPLADGDEYRARQWVHPLHRFDVAKAMQSAEEMGELRAFFNARGGSHRAFLMMDWLDHTSAANGMDAPTMLDCPLGVGDGATTQFQLVKRYQDAANQYDRPIAWPVAGTLAVAKDAVAEAGVSVARGTGLVTFDVAPALGEVLTSGFRFDVPVAFDEDEFSASYDTVRSRSMGSVPISEIRKWL